MDDPVEVSTNVGRFAEEQRLTDAYRAAHPEEFDEETESLIKACNQFDEILFKHAKAKFDIMLAAKKDFVDKGVKELREGSEKNRNMILFKNKVNLFVPYFNYLFISAT